MHPRQPAKNGFTLIELLIVITLSVMLLLTASTLFMTLLVGSSKTNSMQLIKSEGTSAMAQIEFLLRSAITIPDCSGASESLSFQSIDGGTTTLISASDNGDYKIASQSALATRYLTSNSVDVINNEDGLTFNCVQSADGSSKYVSVSFTLQKGITGVDQADEIVQESFTTGINLRNN